LAKESS